MVLAGWMISDVPAAKVMALDAERMMLALEDPATFRRLLYAKNIALWALVAPVCSLLALGIGVNNHPLADLGVSSKDPTAARHGSADPRSREDRGPSPRVRYATDASPTLAHRVSDGCIRVIAPSLTRPLLTRS